MGAKTPRSASRPRSAGYQEDPEGPDDAAAAPRDPSVGDPSVGDPFDTHRLRAAALDAWASSPTRLREDAETESDLRRGGYRDRVLTELVQNAADAAAAAGLDGAVSVWLDAPAGAGRSAGAARLHVANTGAPLDPSGVASLCALRASDKDSGVGRFGLGFTATTAVSDEIEVRSRSGTVVFSRRRTRAAVADRGLPVPDAGVPVLRLPWPGGRSPCAAWDTEVVLILRRDVDPAELLSDAQDEAAELLLELPAVRRIDVGGRSLERTETAHGCDAGDGAGADGADCGPGADGGSPGADHGGGPARPDAPPDARLRRITIGTQTYLQSALGAARWIVPLAGADTGEPDRVRPIAHDVLRAPTRSDERLSLPAMLIADLPMAPDRRRLLPGTDPAPAAEGYPQLVRAVPADQRAYLVPRPGFPLGEVDDSVRSAIAAALWERPWVPTADGGTVAGRRAVLVPGLTAELGGLLADVVDGLVCAELSGPASIPVLTALGIDRLGLAALVELLAGTHREPGWWGRLYDALEPLVTDADAAEALGGMPVPLSDGRTVTGPRTTVLGVGSPGGFDGVTWARLVHPLAARPLLGRLGAGEATPESLLCAPELESLIGSSGEFADTDAVDAAKSADAAGLPEPSGLAHAVLSLAGACGPDVHLPSWSGGLLVPDDAGELRPIDELLVPGAPLADLLVQPSPFGVAAGRIAEEYGVDAMRALGAGWGFTLVREALPTGPDHDLDDEDAWWDGSADEPGELVAVRDLDLVADGRWRAALDLMLGDPRIRPLLSDRRGYTAWWLRRHAHVDGRSLGAYAGEDCAFAGLLDRFDHPEAPALRGVLAGGDVDTPALAAALLDGLEDASRRPDPAVVARAHRALAEAVAVPPGDGTGDAGAVAALELGDLPQPGRVRTADGSVVDPAAALVIDMPWAVAAVPPAAAVPSAGLAEDLHGALADVLGCPLFSETVRAEIVSVGRESTWGREPGAVLAARMQQCAVPSGRVVVHDSLTVRLVALDGVRGGGDHDPGPAGAAAQLDGVDRLVPWWEEADGTVHVDSRWGVPLRRYARLPDNA